MSYVLNLLEDKKLEKDVENSERLYLDEAIEIVKTLNGKPSEKRENLFFLKRLFKSRVITSEEYEDIQGRGIFNPEKTMKDLRDILLQKKLEEERAAPLEYTLLTAIEKAKTLGGKPSDSTNREFLYNLWETSNIITEDEYVMFVGGNEYVGYFNMGDVVKYLQGKAGLVQTLRDCSAITLDTAIKVSDSYSYTSDELIESMDRLHKQDFHPNGFEDQGRKEFLDAYVKNADGSLAFYENGIGRFGNAVRISGFLGGYSVSRYQVHVVQEEFYVRFLTASFSNTAWVKMSEFMCKGKADRDKFATTEGKGLYSFIPVD